VLRKRGESGRRVQLHRALSKLAAGRAPSVQWIQAGEVRVDGRIERDPLAWVDLGRQRIACKNREAIGSQPITLAIHKPCGVVTTRSDERGRKTIYDLLPGLPWIFPAGDSTPTPRPADPDQ